MNVNSNAYTFIYATVLVAVVAVVLAFTAMNLKPLQDENIRVEKMQNILASVGIESTVENASEKFEEYIPESQHYVINEKGEVLEGYEAFNIDFKKELEKESDLHLPLYVAKLDDGKKIIIPVRGKGLWGPVWGYVALNNDYNTIYGVIFDHKGETPGLGAEISTPIFEDQFPGKTIFEGDKLVSINVYKGGEGAAKMNNDTEHGVDAISGGTITSKGVEKMLQHCLKLYLAYFKKNQ